MRDQTAAMVSRAVLSPEAPAGRLAPRAKAAWGAARTGRMGRWGRAAAQSSSVAVAAAATTAVAAAEIKPPLVPAPRQRVVEAAAPAWCRPAAAAPLSPAAARR